MSARDRQTRHARHLRVSDAAYLVKLFILRLRTYDRKIKEETLYTSHHRSKIDDLESYIRLSRVTLISK